jgi:arylsulfatase A-like enzyme
MNNVRRWVLLSVLLTAGMSANAADDRPNIVFLLADDFRWDSFGHLGDFGLKTPNLDSLAGAGVRFSRSYNTTAICQGSRANYMTGLYEFSTGTNFAHGGMANDIWKSSYPHQLKQAGYYTGFAGKFGFHVQEPNGKKGSSETVKPSFDFWAGWMGQGKYEITENPEATGYFERYGNKKEHTTYALGMLGRDFIREAVKKDKPFNLSVSFKAPHGPFDLDERYTRIYADQTFAKPENYGPDENSPAQALSGRPARKGDEWMTDYDRTMYKYHTLVLGLDAAIGMIIEELEHQGVADNTIIIFAADNGFFNGSKGFGGKLYAYEEASRSPTIIYDPRRAPGFKLDGYEVNEVLTGNIDIAPTILEYAGVQPPDGTQGKSLVPVMGGAETELHESVLLVHVWGSASAQSLAVVTPTHKYIHWFYGADGFERSEELFDMRNDQQEQVNLVGDAGSADVLDLVRAMYDGWIETWRAEGVADHGYPKYVRLADRHRPFDSNEQEEIDSMFNDKGDKTLGENNKKPKQKVKQ